VLANRLSADPAVTVLLLEAGGPDDNFWIPIPLGIFKTIGNPRTDWCYTSEPEPGLNGRSIRIPRGKVLGGSSSINGMIHIRGQASDYDHWRALGNAGWGWDEVLPYFRRSEDFMGGADEVHGVGGEWRVEELRTRWEILDAFRDAAGEVGIASSGDFNRGDNDGCGYAHVNQTRGVRLNTARAFLRPAMSRPNLRVLTHAHVNSLSLDGRRAVGVEFRHGNTLGQATARCEVILAAGAIGSPQILQVSGIGPAALLRERGVAVRHDLPGVGENLQDHLQVRMVCKVRNASTINERAGSLMGRLGMGLEYFLFKRGPLTMVPPQMCCFTRSNPAHETPNIQYLVMPMSFDAFADGPHPFPAFTAAMCTLRPASRGHVRIKGPDAQAHPAILHNYLESAEDQRTAVESMRIARRIAAAPALERYAPVEFRPGPQAQSDADLLGYARDNGTTVFHPVGTCSMGHGAMAVVDDRLRVHGLSGLRIVDASIMPTLTSGNTQAPIIMIAEKACDMILADRRAGA
jgi:choline dehydrogenase